MYNKNALTVYVNSCLINSLSTGFVLSNLYSIGKLHHIPSDIML